MIDQIKLIEISQICIRVRKGIDELKQKTSLLQDFPHGCCRDTSLLLAMILAEFGFKNAVYCSKDLDNELPSHAWLEYDEYLLDLTADQYGAQFPAVLIMDGLRRAIHRKDRMQQPGLEIAGMDGPALMNDYKIILGRIGETYMEDDFFDFDSSLEDWEESTEEPYRYHITNVWHEMGHLVGHQMAKRLGYDFGKITELHFGDSPKICTTSIYSPKGNVLKCVDQYGLRNLCFDDPKDIDRITKAVKDKKMTLAYIIYLLSGGLFNIYAVKEAPGESDFNDCYLDSIEDEGVDHITARAGNDWSKVRRLAQIDHWDLEVLVNLRSVLFVFFRDKGMFAVLKPILDNVDMNYNGEIIMGVILTSVEANIEKSLNAIDSAFWKELENLLSEYQLKL